MRSWHVVLLGLLLITAPAAALFEGFGERVDEDPRRNVLETHGPDVFVFIDGNGDGHAQAGDAVLLAADNRLAPGDIWITGDSGHFLEANDAQNDAFASSFQGQVTFVDETGDGWFTSGDILVLDQAGTGSGFLSGDDVVLSGPEAGHFATSDMGGFNAPLTTGTFEAGFVDDGDGQYEPGEWVVIDTNGDSRPTPGDVRMHASGAFGSIMAAGDGDTSLYLRDADGPRQFVFVDENGDSQFNPGDSVYLARDAQQRIGSVRIQGGDGDPGSFVARGDGDADAPRLDLAYGLLLDGSDDFVDIGERLVLDIQAVGTAGATDPHDLLLTGDQAGQPLSAAGMSSGANLRQSNALILYVDLDGDRRFGTDDLAYYDGDGNRYVSTGDIQLSVVPSLVPVEEPPEEPEEPEENETEDPDGGGSDDEGEPGGDGDDEPADGPADDEDDVPAEEPAIPGFGLVAGLLALGALVLRRR